MDERALLALAPSPDTYDAGVQLARTSQFSELRRTADEQLVFGLCAGSGATPYAVSADFVTDPPTGRCSCPSRKRPCKHVLGLLVVHARAPASFVVGELPADLAEKRAKSADKAEKAASPVKPKKPKVVNKAAEEKKARAQLDGLDVAQKVLTDLATTGLGALDEAGREALQVRAREVADFHLPGVALGLRRLALALAVAGDAEARMAPCARLVAKLSTMVRKGRAVLGQRIDGEETTAGEADAFVEELLGKVWQLTELREKGFVLENASLVELAYERFEDEAREEQVETSWLLELGSGEIHRDCAYVPLRRVGKDAAKQNHEGVVSVPDAAIYPGLGNRRVRWDAGAESVRPLDAAARAAMVARAQPVAAAVSAYTTQLKNLLAPDERVALVQVAKLGRVGETLMLEDPAGGRLAFSEDARSAPALRVLELIGWPSGAQAIVVVLVADFFTGRVLARPLSIVTATSLLRLSL